MTTNEHVAAGVTACANCHANVAPEYRCKDCPNGVAVDRHQTFSQNTPADESKAE